MPLVEFNDVTFGYKEDDYLLLRNLSFTVEKNDIITVIGASGCGKSTLFRLMTCLEKEYKGSISINGKSPAKALLLYRCGISVSGKTSLLPPTWPDTKPGNSSPSQASVLRQTGAEIPKAVSG